MRAILIQTTTLSYYKAQQEHGDVHDQVSSPYSWNGLLSEAPFWEMNELNMAKTYVMDWKKMTSKQVAPLGGISLLK